MLTGLGYLWSVMVCWVRSMAGRKRHSVLAALNAVTHQLVTVTTDLTVNAETMKDLRSKLHAMVGETGTKTVIILDNSRYQHCAAVKQFLNERELAFEERDVTRPEVALEAKTRYGVRVAPITVIGDSYFYGTFQDQRAKLEAALQA